jgi:hypothetical protein
MPWNLFIDDERVPTDVTWGSPEFYAIYPWTVARTKQRVMELIAMYGFPDFVSFDHDLGANEPSGKDIANWMINTDMDEDYRMPDNFQFYVHSRNPVGKANIENLLIPYLAYRV